MDHDDTTVNSTATIHFPSFCAYLQLVRPQAHYTLEEYFRKNFDPGIMALIPRSGLAYNSSVLSDTLSSAGGQCQTSAAVTAIDIPHQQRPSLCIERHIIMSGHPFFHHLLCPFISFCVDNLKLWQHL